MSNQVSADGEARFITREFAETIAGKTAALWLGWLFPRIQRKATDDPSILEGEATLQIVSPDC